ncbi:MAG: ABC transporter permease [Anaerolineales bacterium]|nr:ABC transporter permease [Anaerolineales bacterium]
MTERTISEMPATLPRDGDAGEEETPARTPRLWALAKGVFARNTLTIAALLVVAVFVLFALLAEYIAPYPPDRIHMTARMQPPSSQYWLGTDNMGRDLLSRVIYGTRGVLITSVVAAFLGVIWGTIVGLVSGYAGGWVDEIVMRLVDAMLALPSILLALLLLARLGASRLSIVLGIGIVYTPTVARVVRSAVLAVKNAEFVHAARLRGEPTLYILFREILPNIWSPIVVEASIRMSYAILLTASFGFLGLGVQEPEPDWGLMVSRARDYIQVAPWMAIVPVVAISLLVISLSLVADSLRERMGGLPGSSQTT